MATREAPAVLPQGPALSIPGLAPPARRRALARSFYARPAPVVARHLLGRELVEVRGASLVVARIVEAEAYQQDDPASHSYRGRTARTEVMFGPPGHLYVYFSYGVHWCMNVVTGRHGEGSAVLLRAAEPLEGLDVMRARRGGASARLLCAGPGRLTRALAVDRSLNGMDLVAGDQLWIGRGRPVPDDHVVVSERVGVTVARDRPWRFFESGNPFVSRGTGATRASGSVTATVRGAVRSRRSAPGSGSASAAPGRPGA